MKYAIKSLAGFAALALAVPTGSAAVNTYTFGLHTGIFSVNLDPDAYYDDAAPCPGTTFPLAVNGAEWGTGTLTIYSDPSTPWWQVYVFGCSGQNLDSASAYLPAHAGPWTGQEIVDALDAVPWHTGVWLISATAGPGGSAAVSTYTFGLQAGTFSVNLGPEAYYDAGPDPDGFVFPLSVNGSGWATGTLTIYSHPSTPWWGVQVLDSSGDGVAAASAYLPAHAGPWTGREIVDAVAEVSGHTGVCFISVTPVCQPKHAPILCSN